MALIEFNDDVGGRHPWEVLNTQRSEVKMPYCKVVVYGVTYVPVLNIIDCPLVLSTSAQYYLCPWIEYS